MGTDEQAGGVGSRTSDSDRLRLVGRVLDLLPDFFYVHDYDMRFWYANQKAAAYFGRASKEDLIGRTLEEVDPNPAQALFFKDVCRKVMDAGVPRLTENLPYVRPDGSAGILRQHDIPYTDPATGRKMLMGLSRDVTAERELERERVRRASLEREMEIAREIQKSLRPSAAPTGCANFSMAAFAEPAAYAGGDFYDWFATADGSLAVVIGDVTGHGIGPALLAAECRAYARVLLETMPLGPAMARLHELLAGDLTDGRFITLAAAMIDAGTGRTRILSCGHGPLLIARRGGASERLEAQLPPLGIIPPDPTTPPHETDLLLGERLVLVSDGVYESQNRDGRQYGTRRLRDVLSRPLDPPGGPGDLIDAIRSDVAAFTGPTTAADDITIVVAGR